MTLSLEEDILLSAGLLTPDYDPESELEEGQKHLSLEERKEDLEDAREAFKEVKGRVQKIAWEGGQPWEVGKDVPSMPSLKVAHIFGSMRENLPVAYVLGDMRVYCEPKQSLPGDGYRLIVINRASPAVLHEPLTRDSFIDEIALEIRHQLREECAE